MKEKIPITEEILLTIPQAALLVHTDVSRMRALVRDGHIRALKLGELKIRRQEIDRFLKEAEGLDYSDTGNIRRLDNGAV